MIRRASITWTTLVWLGIAGAAGAASDESAAELYGRGVHAYFAGDYALAVDMMSQAIAQRANDPRAYYFRGLAQANLHGVDAGMPDFLQGADVEYNNTRRPIVDINGALQRVQGALRMELEKVRAATLQAARERQRLRNRVRYEELKRREDVVLFDPQRPAAPLDITLPAPDLGGKPDPFASGLAFSGGRQVADATPSAVTATTPDAADTPHDPFTVPTPKLETPSAPEDPFATPVAKSAAGAKPAAGAKTADATPEADAVNPFGEDLPKLELEYEDELPSATAQAARSVLNLIGKAVSSQPAERDPFAPPKKKGERGAAPATGPAPAPAGSAQTPDDAAAPKPSDVTPPSDDDDPFR